jgi:hypothetical protein
MEQRRTVAWPPIPEGVQVAIVFLPVLLTLLFVAVFAVDLPIADQWEVVPAVMHMESGHLQWSDIYRQHNEAVMPVSMAVTLLLAKVTHYDVNAEAFVAFGCLTVGLVVLFAFFRRVQRTVPIPTLAFLPISTIFLGWRGHEGILWGAGLYINLGLMFLLLTIWAALRATESPRFVGLAMVMAVLATFSFGSGLVAWPIGLAVLLFPTQGRRSPLLLLLWTAAAVASTATYFHGYAIHRVPWPTGSGFVLAHPVMAAQYALVYTGSALGATPRADAWINVVLILLFLPAAWSVVRNDDAFIEDLAGQGIAYVPFFPLGGFTPLQSSELDAAARSLNATPMQVALAWLLHRSPNILLIPGTSSLQHLRENLAAATLKLPPEILSDLDAIGRS